MESSRTPLSIPRRGQMGRRWCLMICMNKSNKRISKLFSNSNIEKSDQINAFGWHSEIDPSGQRKRFLRSIAKETQKSP